MSTARRLARLTFIMLGLLTLMPGCVIEPREGYYDHEHHRWWHEHAWHDCDDAHCHH